MRILIIALLFGCSLPRSQHESPYPHLAAQRNLEHKWDTRFGTVVCTTSERSTCGITLWNCVDSMIYHCLLDLREHIDL